MCACVQGYTHRQISSKPRLPPTGTASFFGGPVSSAGFGGYLLLKGYNFIQRFGSKRKHPPTTTCLPAQSHYAMGEEKEKTRKGKRI